MEKTAGADCIYCITSWEEPLGYRLSTLPDIHCLTMHSMESEMCMESEFIA